MFFPGPRDFASFSEHLEKNFKHLYNQFYNFLPSFFGHGFRGAALVLQLGMTETEKAFQVGVELGFFLQFGVFAYMISGVYNRRNKNLIKENLRKISTIVPFITLDTVEEILKSAKKLRIGQIQEDFILMTVFHANRFLGLL